VSQEMKQQRPTKIQRKTYRDHDRRLLETKEQLNNKQINLLEYQQKIRFVTYGYIKSNETNEDDSDSNDDS